MKNCFTYIILVFFIIGCEKDTKIIDEPLYQEQWALHYDKPFYDAYEINEKAHINAEETLETYTGKGVRIAIIDIGIDKNHKEYKDTLKKIINSRDGSEDIICDDFRSCYHGTAVTGVIASAINNEGLRGIAPESEIVFISLDLKGYVGDDEILDALNYAEKENVDIVNASWGTGNVSLVVKAKIDSMARNGRDGKGMIFVFAAGNNGKEVMRDESMLESVIGVGSTDEENLRAIYSNFGEGLDIMAPGGFNLGITTTYPLDDDTHVSPYMKAEDYKKFQGTSASTPIVTASVALLLEKNPRLTRLQVQKLLRSNSDKIGNVEYINGHNKYYGYGKLNVDKAIFSTKY